MSWHLIFSRTLRLIQVQFVFVAELIKYTEIDKKKKEIEFDILFHSCHYIKCLAHSIKHSLEIKQGGRSDTGTSVLSFRTVPNEPLTASAEPLR